MEKLDNGWELSEDKKKISKVFQLPDFLPAIDFVRKVGEDAEQRDHHLDIKINIKKVTLELTTYEAGEQLTDKDFESAKAIDEIYKNFTEE